MVRKLLLKVIFPSHTASGPPPEGTKMRRSIALPVMAFGLAISSVSSVAHAQTTYLGADNNVSTLAQMTNSVAARNNFIAVAGSLNLFDFESAIPANLMITGGTTVFNSGSCGALCGFNTSPGGSNFRQVEGGTVTFAFTNPDDAFGFFVNGLQTNAVPQQTVTYTNGAGQVRTVNMPASNNGGGAFVGFIDFGQLISSVTFNATNDILGFDDLRFGRSATNPANPSAVVPEPSTYALMATGLAGLFLQRRKRRNG